MDQPREYAEYREFVRSVHDAEHRPPTSRILSSSEYFWMFVVTLIPLIGFVYLFVWAFSPEANPNKRSYARSRLVIFAIAFLALCTYPLWKKG